MYSNPDLAYIIIIISVADPDPGSCSFLPPGSGMEQWSDPDPGWSNGRIRIRDKTSRIRNTDLIIYAGQHTGAF
jgi:hypothetical protein